ALPYVPRDMPDGRSLARTGGRIGEPRVVFRWLRRNKRLRRLPKTRSHGVGAEARPQLHGHAALREQGHGPGAVLRANAREWPSARARTRVGFGVGSRAVLCGTTSALAEPEKDGRCNPPPTDRGVPPPTDRGALRATDRGVPVAREVGQEPRPHCGRTW